MPGKKPNETASERVATIASKQLSSSKISADVNRPGFYGGSKP
jgi:hypothetical protein